MSTTDNPVALVTGAGRGIGRAVAVRLSSHGYRVALTSRSEDELRETARICTGETLVLAQDLTSSSGVVDRLVTAVEGTWGGIEVLIANAGTGAAAPLAKTTDALWDRMLELNLTVPFRCIRRVVPGMVERGQGRIVAVASVAAKRGEPYISAYTASKHGLLGLIRSAAAELATTGVTVNAICPGFVDTQMTERNIEQIAEKTGRSPAEARATLEAKQPIGRLVSVDEVATAVWACLDNKALNGQGIIIDGGGVQS